jgi:hypothetical protein
LSDHRVASDADPAGRHTARGYEQAVGRQVIRYSERPELWKDTTEITNEVWPEYNLHSEDPHDYWGRLFEEFPEFQTREPRC